jgi:aminomethyltransferase
MNRTPLYEAHRAAGGKLVDFAGWEMPIQYSGVLDEYHAVRRQAGLFDVSHMGRLLVTGPDALPFLQQVTTNDVERLAVGQAHYSLVCNPAGGIKDDIFVYRLELERYLLCVNASNRQKISAWFVEQGHTWACCHMEDQSGALAQIALQGPAAREILSTFGNPAAQSLQLRHCAQLDLCGVSTLVARTGYTGELGYEFYVPSSGAERLWSELLTRGKANGLKPAGLGARDLLRLEMAYLLYGNDIDESTSPLEAGVEWAVSFAKESFVGKDPLVGQKRRGVARRLVAFELTEKAVPRHGCKVLDPKGDVVPIGDVTSGNFSTLLQKGIGLAYVPSTYAQPGTALFIDIRGKALPAVVVKPPFYRKPRANSV